MVTILCETATLHKDPRYEKHRFETIEAVLFDKDGTLANVEPYLMALGEARADEVARLVPGVRDDVLAAFGQQRGQIDPAGMMAVGARAENEIAAAAYVAATGAGWIESLNLVRVAFDSAAESLPAKVGQTPILPGAIALLQRLRDSGLKIGIVSSDTHAEVTSFIECYSLSVDWHCGEGGASLSKTQPGFLHLACRSLEVDPSKTLVVGDSASDERLSMQGAAGFIAMVGGWSIPPRFSAQTAIVTHLSQVQTSRE